ncbi:MAG: hypothetical protein OIF50_05290 [Flavobacteriaceae bacterium]|nr:hypothetical protein [Flavobacteriaceae bacterium]
MTNTHKDALFILMKSLSKSEKRQFRLYVGRLGVNTDAKFIALFNLLDKLTEYSEKVILQSGIVKKQQLSNLKAHLYKQILVSLRMNPVNQNIRIQIREQLDFATILYNKGLYKQSLKILDKVKSVAVDHEEKNIAYEIVELEKVIETQYITRSISSRADELAIQAKELSTANVLASKLSNLSLQLYGLILKMGYVKNDDEYRQISAYFYRLLPEIDITNLGFREKLWYFQANLWYSLLTQDFISCFKYSKKWVDLFEEFPKMVGIHPVFYLKGQQYLLESLFLLNYYSKFKEARTKMMLVIEGKKFPKNDNLCTIVFLNKYVSALNQFFMQGDFEAGIDMVPELLRAIEKEKDRLDEHHIMVFYYKIACLYFGKGDHKNCIHYLKIIIQNKNLVIREDLMCFSRVLSLVSHYEAGLDYHLERQLRTTYKFLLKMNELHVVQKEMIKFLKNLGNIYPHQLKQAFIDLHKELKKYEHHPYEKRAFLYLDILSWLESRIENRPVGEIIRNKAKKIMR